MKWIAVSIVVLAIAVVTGAAVMAYAGGDDKPDCADVTSPFVDCD